MNKNTKNLRNLANKSARDGATEFAMDMPTDGYHNSSKGAFQTRRIPLAKRSKDGTVSANTRRNTKMVVSWNEADNGKSSLTTHEPLNPMRAMTFKNHGYIRKTENDENLYQQLANVR